MLSSDEKNEKGSLEDFLMNHFPGRLTPFLLSSLRCEWYYLNKTFRFNINEILPRLNFESININTQTSLRKANHVKTWLHGRIIWLTDNVWDGNSNLQLWVEMSQEMLIDYIFDFLENSFSRTSWFTWLFSLHKTSKPQNPEFFLEHPRIDFPSTKTKTNRVPCDATSLKERVKRMKFSTLFNNHLGRVKNAKRSSWMSNDSLGIPRDLRFRTRTHNCLLKVKIQFANA